jgi:hypothetical protein
MAFWSNEVDEIMMGFTTTLCGEEKTAVNSNYYLG